MTRSSAAATRPSRLLIYRTDSLPVQWRPGGQGRTDPTLIEGSRLAILHFLLALLSHPFQFAVRFKPDLEALYARVYRLVAHSTSQYADLIQCQAVMHSFEEWRDVTPMLLAVTPRRSCGGRRARRRAAWRCLSAAMTSPTTFDEPRPPALSAVEGQRAGGASPPLPWSRRRPSSVASS